MFPVNKQFVFSAVAMAYVATSVAPSQAITIDVDGNNYATLSAAVAAAYLADDGPDIINIAVNSLPVEDVQILLDKPITINGDGESSGAGDGTSCDILVDMAGIMAETVDVGDSTKNYLELVAVGDVIINDLNIHPNANGVLENPNNNHVVNGIRANKPVNSGEIGNYMLTNVRISGSDGNNGHAFVPLDTGADLYNQPGIELWGGDTGNGGAYATIQLANSGGAGIYNVTLDHCHAGLCYSAAINIPVEGGTQKILGGLYGHAGRDGIRVTGTGVSVEGTHNDRVRIVRAANISGGNTHCFEAAGGATISNLSYVDAAGVTTANAFNLRGGTQLANMEFCRGLGKFDKGANQTLYISDGATAISNIHDCTIHSGNNFPAPVQIAGSIVNPIAIKDCIFTSFNSGTVNIVPTDSGIVTLANCALPTDGVTSETLGDPPINGGNPADVTASVSVSPNYLLTLPDYDWSDNQGAGQPGNAVGNANVLRPSNPAYLTASSTAGPLNGGAGAPAAGIDPSVWMLME